MYEKVAYSPYKDIPLVTALPANPVNGDMVVLVDSMTAPTYEWMLKYVAAKSSNKWVFVGGSAKVSSVTADETSSTTGGWLNLATVGPTFTIPVAGTYLIYADATFYSGSANGHLYTGVVAGTGGTPAPPTQGSAQCASVNAAICAQLQGRLALSANDVLTQRYYLGVAGTYHVQHRYMHTQPVEIGG